MTSPLLAFYGDDFTGSADAMEVLQWSGLRTVLFLEPPTRDQLREFSELAAFGVAGWSRTMSPAEMETELRPAFSQLRASGAEIVHYKTCSTFDSSPQIGSVGKALELGREVFGTSAVPMVIGAPNLGRYQVFGNLFARSGLDTEPFRLDRHPTMSRHPITPMAEADLRLHLAEQTRLKIGLIDILRLHAVTQEDLSVALEQDSYDAILFDVLYPDHLSTIGAAIQRLAERVSPKFIVGSSGMEYALTEHWAAVGKGGWAAPGSRPTFAASEQLVVITGSCSPVNDRQIAWAEQHGFELLPIDTPRLIEPASSDREIERIMDLALKRLQARKNVVLHSSRGPQDPRIGETVAAMKKSGLGDLEIKRHSGRILGPKLGCILKGILEAFPLSRIGVAGGDTSGYIARELGITALEAIAPVAPGSPLCRAYGGGRLDGVEFFFKGGQVGKNDVWGTMLGGTKTT